MTVLSSRLVIDAHGHLLVPEANALADGHPRQRADEAAEREAFTAAKAPRRGGRASSRPPPTERRVVTEVPDETSGLLHVDDLLAGEL